MQKHVLDSPKCQEMSYDSPPRLREEQTQLDTNLPTIPQGCYKKTRCYKKLAYLFVTMIEVDTSKFM